MGEGLAEDENPVHQAAKFERTTFAISVVKNKIKLCTAPHMQYILRPKRWMQCRVTLKLVVKMSSRASGVAIGKFMRRQ